ncbi:MAG: hypothetical protein IKR84_01920 [Oscillibacter sp.]|nr:hypothetical protein [Oscillibacter sp.]
MENQEKITPTRRERVNAILDTLGDFAERDFSLIFSFGRAYVQLLDGGLSGLAAAHYEPVKTERTDYGTIQREAVIGGVTYTEVEILPRKPLTCPVCGVECGRVFRSERGVVLGCDICLTAVEEYEDAEASETLESHDETPQA